MVTFKYYRIGVLFFFLGMTACLPPSGSQDTWEGNLPEQVDFNFHIKPILSDRCFACHGPDEKAREAQLRLDREGPAFAALKESEGFAIVPGKPGESALVHRIMSEDPDLVMPPPTSEMVLTPQEKALIVKWIEQGATWKDHWAFIPPEKPEVPEVRDPDGCLDEMDYFVARKREEKGLKAASPAPRGQWLRRVTFDLTGLPPTPAEIADFLADDSESAYETVVDRLLADPAYGERMASTWLDVARYADSHGYQDDRPRTAWPWRDWVIRAFNENLPYDQFVTWQLAGDLLPQPTYDQKLATGFNRNHAITQEGGVVEEEYLTEYAADRVNTFSTAFLGVTMECARCHTHKYDPLTQAEYYSLMSFFNNIPERGKISYFDEAPYPNMPLKDSLREQQIAEVQRWISEEEKTLAGLKKTEVAEFEAWLEQTRLDQGPGESLKAGLLTHFDLDHRTNEDQYTATLPDRPLGRLNINLPEKIELPNAVPGRSGKALKFDGANFLSLGEIGDFEWYDDFSFGGWVRHSGAHKKNAGIFARRVGEQKRQGYDLVLTPENRLSARLIHQYVPADRRGKGIYDAVVVSTLRSMAPGEWHHVFVTYDGSGKAAGLKIYLDGEPQPLRVEVDSLRRKTIASGNDFLVGNWNHRARELGDLYGFKGGEVDEVHLYGRQLSPWEVRSLAGDLRPLGREALYAHYLQRHSPRFQTLTHLLDSLRRIDQAPLEVMIMEEMDSIKTTYLLDRGAYDAPTIEVSRGTPEAILPFSEKYPQNRLGLAQWLFSQENPLTSRVMVNRMWQMFFGKGLVNTPEDFGNQGAFPTHPELLDHLAVSFRESGWDMKGLARRIVLSATYRQDASFSPASLTQDKANTWLTRGPAQRLTAEMVRDQALVASELYHDQVGGKWVKPYQPPGIWKELANQIGENKYRPSLGKGLYRRSLYSYWKRTIPPPAMLTFDASERSVCTVRRQQTSTPLQALVLLNAPIYLEASRQLAAGLLGPDVEPEQQIEQAFFRILSRKPRENEVQLLAELYESQHRRFSEKSEDADRLLAIGASEIDPSVPDAELAAMTVVVNTIFNLDEAKFK